MRIQLKIQGLIVFIVIVFFSLTNSSCTKLVQVKAPITSVNQENVYANDATAISVLTGIYIAMNNGGYNVPIFTGDGSISEYAGLSSDEFTLWSGISSTDTKYYYFTNALLENGPHSYLQPGTEFWSPLYNYIFTCNSAIEGVIASKSLSPSIKQQLLGEAEFMRAFFYFYLLNLYGDVPLVTSTDWQANAILPRSSKAIVYLQIINDLKDAKSKLNVDFLDENLQEYTSSTPERTRPTKESAEALLSRIELYAGNFSEAEAEADSVIVSPKFSLTSLNDAFLANSSEAIWQLQPVILGHNTEDAWTFIIPSGGPNSSVPNPVYLTKNLLNSFEPNDQRRLNWVDSVIISPDTFYFPSKYKIATLNAPVTEYLMVLRLGELYLIRAEARVHQGNITGGQTDLNMMRIRAGLPSTIANDQDSLLAAILHEKQVELFTEWGHRWLDLKRTGNVDNVMSIVTPEKANGASWQSYQQLYPLLITDIQEDPNLVQNPGY